MESVDFRQQRSLLKNDIRKLGRQEGLFIRSAPSGDMEMLTNGGEIISHLLDCDVRRIKHAIAQYQNSLMATCLAPEHRKTILGQVKAYEDLLGSLRKARA